MIHLVLESTEKNLQNIVNTSNLLYNFFQIKAFESKEYKTKLGKRKLYI